MAEAKVELSGVEYRVLTNACMSCGAKPHESWTALERLETLGPVERSHDGSIYRATELGRTVWGRG